MLVEVNQHTIQCEKLICEWIILFTVRGNCRMGSSICDCEVDDFELTCECKPGFNGDGETCTSKEIWKIDKAIWVFPI